MPANDPLPSHVPAWMMVRNHSSRAESHPCDKTRTCSQFGLTCQP
ncbi:hypothetical protein NC652_031746 [Populus alba x Populus x berolinensis]|uniref:Uncharacterized protein n=1 Tax=Populus alba x Populus x berolinensis TaxID=444605 RepID=A0AAD6LZ30_9ROSI|nr:hypothetical protein NC652_031746 [Populus alba x Populus x berolinensis]KAJ6975762.1 hypothetical protein NC653_031556 [Populus alba x Populus x berolinensis]